jgi:integrase
MGHIKKRNGRWQAAWRDPQTHKEVTRTFAKRVEAENHLISVEHSKLSGAYVDPAAGKVTFGEFAEQWRAVQVHRHGTQVSVEQHLRLHVYPVIGKRTLASIRPGDIQALVHRLGQQLAPSTVHIVYGRVVGVFKAAVRDRLISSSPSVGVRLPAAAAPSVLEVLDADQVTAVAAAVPDHYRALVMAGAGLGLRPGELFGLAVDRLDFLRHTVRVDQQVARMPGGGVGLTLLKTPASYRSVPLPDVVAEEVAAHLARWPAHPDLGVIFTTSHGGLVQQHPWADVWATACRRAGLPKWATPHDLRHFYASMLIRSGASVKVVQARLGHSSAKTTLDTYGHLFPDEEDRTRAFVDAALRPSAADFSRTTTAP